MWVHGLVEPAAVASEDHKYGALVRLHGKVGEDLDARIDELLDR